MLNYIVLGQIPGTNIFLSYTAVSVGFIVMGLGALAYIHRADIDRLRQKHNRDDRNKINQISI